VAVTGMVEKFAEITPERITLTGLTGQSLFVEVEIIPRKEYPFVIRNLNAASGRFFTYKMEEKNTGKQNSYIIRVENTRTEKGRYADIIFVHTDSPVRPKITIPVIGMIN
jgi:hypothetical protein